MGPPSLPSMLRSGIRRCLTLHGHRGPDPVAPDPARLERAATLANCGQDAPLPGRCALGGFDVDATPNAGTSSREFPDLSALSGGGANPQRMHEILYQGNVGRCPMTPLGPVSPKSKRSRPPTASSLSTTSVSGSNRSSSCCIRWAGRERTGQRTTQRRGMTGNTASKSHCPGSRCRISRTLASPIPADLSHPGSRAVRVRW